MPDEVIDVGTPDEQNTSWTVNEPVAEEGQESTGGALGSTNAPKEASMDKAIDKAVAKTKAPAEKKEAKPIEPQSEEDKAKAVAAKRKLKVGDEELEMDEEAITRWAQKGIHYEKKNYNIAKTEKELNAKLKAAAAKEAEVLEVYEALQSDTALEIFEKKHGAEKARALAEAYLRPKVETEMKLAEMTPVERKAYEAEQRAAAAEAKLAERDQKDQEVALTAEEKKWSEHYQSLIIEGLKVGGVPRTDFTAAEMAAWIRRGKKEGVQYTPQQLAGLVKQDNIIRVNALTENYVNQINEAKKSGDATSIVKAGEALVELLGEPVMYALAKYHLAKRMNDQSVLPSAPVDTAKTDLTVPKKRMTWDEQKELTRKRAAAVDRGEQVPEW